MRISFLFHQTLHPWALQAICTVVQHLELLQLAVKVHQYCQGYVAYNPFQPSCAIFKRYTVILGIPRTITILGLKFVQSRR